MKRRTNYFPLVGVKPKQVKMLLTRLPTSERLLKRKQSEDLSLTTTYFSLNILAAEIDRQSYLAQNS